MNDGLQLTHDLAQLGGFGRPGDLEQFRLQRSRLLDARARNSSGIDDVTDRTTCAASHIRAITVSPWAVVEVMTIT